MDCDNPILFWVGLEPPLIIDISTVNHSWPSYKPTYPTTVKQSVISHHPWLGMVNIAPVKMVMTGGWFIIWLVVYLPPLKNDGVRQLGWWNSQYDGKNNPNVPNHQPVIVSPTSSNSAGHDLSVWPRSHHSMLELKIYHGLGAETSRFKAARWFVNPMNCRYLWPWTIRFT